jgi:hypothetical protein
LRRGRCRRRARQDGRVGRGACPRRRHSAVCRRETPHGKTVEEVLATPCAAEKLRRSNERSSRRSTISSTEPPRYSGTLGAG